MTNDAPTALLFSGGLDSYCIAELLRHRGEVFDLFYVPHDLPYGETEYLRVHELAREMGIPDKLVEAQELLHFSLHVHENGFIPARNQLLVTFAAMYGYQTVYVGAVRGEESLDKSPLFFEHMSTTLSYQLSENIRVAAPYRKHTKEALVKNTLRLGLTTPRMLKMTHSCYNPPTTNQHKEERKEKELTVYAGCGECQACIRRWQALAPLDIHEVYYTDPATAALKQAAKPWEYLPRLANQPVARWPEIVGRNIEAVRRTVHAYRKRSDREPGR